MEIFSIDEAKQKCVTKHQCKHFVSVAASSKNANRICWLKSITSIYVRTAGSLWAVHASMKVECTCQKNPPKKINYGYALVVMTPFSKKRALFLCVCIATCCLSQMNTGTNSVPHVAKRQQDLKSGRDITTCANGTKANPNEGG